MIKIPPKISGPISFSEYKYNQKPLLLFGDIHNSVEGMCENCSYLDPSLETPKILVKSKDCYTLSAWIQKILEDLEGTDLYLDLYVEDRNFVLQKKAQQIRFDGRLTELDIFNNQIHSNLRFHSVDFRAYERTGKRFRIVSTHLTATFKRIVYLFQKYPNTSPKQIVDEMEDFWMDRDNLLRDYAFLCASSTRYSEDLDDFLSQSIKKTEETPFTLFKPLYIKIIQNLMNSKSMVKQYEGKEIHPIGKQFRKLLVQEKYKGNIQKRIEFMAGFIIDQNFWPWMSDREYDYIMDVVEKTKEKILTEENTMVELEIFKKFCLNKYIVSYLMDLYAIPRILFHHPNSEIKIYSAGMHHINILEDFLGQFYPKLQGRCVISASEDIRCLYTKGRRKGKCPIILKDDVIVRKFT